MSPLSIVIADDNREHAESLAMVLTLWGHDVNVCQHHNKTIDCCMKHWPDVVLLDIGFPLRSDGLSVASQLREWPRLRDAAIIAVTCFGDMETRELAMAADFDHYMVKPVDLDELKQILALIKPQKKSPTHCFILTAVLSPFNSISPSAPLSREVKQNKVMVSRKITSCPLLPLNCPPE